MAALELHDTDGPVLRENVLKAIQGLEQPLQKVQRLGRNLSVVTITLSTHFFAFMNCLFSKNQIENSF